MSRFLCLGDNHVGQGVRGAVSPERLAEQEQVLRDVLQIARDAKVQAVLHAGDLLHHRSPVPAVMLAAERPLVEHQVQGGPTVVMVNGNHCVSGTAESAAVDVFHEAGLIELHRRPGITMVAGVAVACLPWVPVSRIVAGQDGGDRDDVNVLTANLLLETARGLRAEVDGSCVLLAHFSVEGASLPSGLSIDRAREPILSIGDLEAIGFDAVVLGHIHKPQSIALDFQQRPAAEEQRRGPHVVYVGSPMPLDFGEGGYEHGCWLLEGPPFTARFIPIVSRSFVTADCDFTLEAISDESSYEDELFGAVHLAAYRTGVKLEGALAKVRYRATAEQARRIDHAAVRQALLDAGAHQVWIEPTIERETRARVQGIDETIDDVEALELWIASQGLNGDQAPALRAKHGDYLQEIQ